MPRCKTMCLCCSGWELFSSKLKCRSRITLPPPPPTFPSTAYPSVARTVLYLHVGLTNVGQTRDATDDTAAPPLFQEPSLSQHALQCHYRPLHRLSLVNDMVRFGFGVGVGGGEEWARGETEIIWTATGTPMTD